MSIGLLTALLLAGQIAKPAELPIDSNVTCTAEEATFGQVLYPAGCYAVQEPETLDVVPTEEEEPEVCGRAEPLPCRKPEPVEARVAELLEACQRAIADGNRDEAQVLIYQAMMLDPDGIAVKALAERLQEMEQSANPVEESKEQPCEDPSGLTPVDPITAPEETLEPPLPPVDPEIVRALENVLRETGEPTEAKLLVGMEEPAEDEPEEPVSQWRSGASEVEIPSLLVDPDEEDPAPEEPEAGEESLADPDEVSGAELEQMLCEACQAIQRGDYVKVEKQPPASSQPVQVGGIQCGIVLDDWGHRYLIVKLAPEASGDLRLMQEAHNQRVLNWIVAQNSGGNREVTVEQPAGCESEELEELRESIENPEPEEEAAS